LNDQQRFPGHVAAMLAILIWGFAFIVITILLRSFAPAEIFFYRFSLATLALYLIYPRRMRRNTLRQELLFAAAGLFGVTLHFLLQDFALMRTAASNASAIGSASPILTGLLLWLFAKSERPNRSFFFGAACALLGIGLISFAGTQLELHPLGDLLVLISAFSWATYSVLLKKIGDLGHHPIQVTRRIFTYGLIYLIPVMIVTDFRFGFERFLEPVNLLPILYLGLLSSAISFTLWNFSLNRLGPARTSVYLYLLPIITVVGAMLILDQEITPLKAAGIGLVLIGLVLSNRKKKGA